MNPPPCPHDGERLEPDGWHCLKCGRIDAEKDRDEPEGPRKTNPPLCPHCVADAEVYDNRCAGCDARLLAREVAKELTE
jgi:hypothetical protein